MMVVMSNIIILLYALVSSLGLILLKLGGQSGAPIYWEGGKVVFNLSLLAISGIALYGVSFIIYMYLISKNDLGYIIPLTTALVYIFIFVASFIIFKEAFSMTKIASILLILTGLVLLNSGR